MGNRPSDEVLLAALAAYPVMETTDYVEAAWLLFGLRRDGFEIEAVGLGKRLSRLAREGRCEVEYGFVSRYRPVVR